VTGIRRLCTPGEPFLSQCVALVTSRNVWRQ